MVPAAHIGCGCYAQAGEHIAPVTQCFQRGTVGAGDGVSLDHGVPGGQPARVQLDRVIKRLFGALFASSQGGLALLFIQFGFQHLGPRFDTLVLGVGLGGKMGITGKQQRLRHAVYIQLRSVQPDFMAKGIEVQGKP